MQWSRVWPLIKWTGYSNNRPIWITLLESEDWFVKVRVSWKNKNSFSENKKYMGKAITDIFNYPFSLSSILSERKKWHLSCNSNYHLSTGREGNVIVRKGKKLPVPCTLDKKAVYKTVSFKQRLLDQIKRGWAVLQNNLIYWDRTMKLWRKKLKFAHQIEQYLNSLPSKEHNKIHAKCLQEPRAGKLLLCYLPFRRL